MEILGIGTAELIAILLIMLVVAGPKRMIQWAYILGQYVAKLRTMWADAMAMVQKEVDAAGLDVQVPKDLPTRANLNRHINKAMNVVTKPAQTAMNEVKAEILEVQVSAVKSVDIAE